MRLREEKGREAEVRVRSVNKMATHKQPVTCMLGPTTYIERDVTCVCMCLCVCEPPLHTHKRHTHTHKNI